MSHLRISFKTFPFTLGFLCCLSGNSWIKASENPNRLWASRIPISLEGTISPIDTLRVQTSVSGRITSVAVKENDVVQKNQLLLTLKNDTQKQQLELVRLQLKINQNNLKDRSQQIVLAEVQLKTSKNAVKDRERQLKLLELQVETSRNNLKDRNRQVILAETQVGISQNSLKDQETNLKDIERRLKDEHTLFEQGSSTKSQLDAVQLQKDRGLLSLDNAKLNLSRSEENVEGAKIAVKNAENVVLRAEQDVEGGKLVVENAKLALMRGEQELVRAKLAKENGMFSVKLSEQEVILRQDSLEDTFIRSKIAGIVTSKSFEVGEVVGNGAKLFDIINIDRVEIKVGVEEEDLSRIDLGQKVVFISPGYPNQRFAGVVDRLSWTANTQNGKFPVYVHAENPDLKLRSGMSVKVYLVDSQ